MSRHTRQQFDPSIDIEELWAPRHSFWDLAYGPWDDFYFGGPYDLYSHTMLCNQNYAGQGTWPRVPTA